MKDEVMSESQDYEGMSVIATEKLIELRERIAELKAERDESNIVLNRACNLYCQWQYTGYPPMEPSSVAYEMVSAIRTALAKQEGGDGE